MSGNNNINLNGLVGNTDEMNESMTDNAAEKNEQQKGQVDNSQEPQLVTVTSEGKKKLTKEQEMDISDIMSQLKDMVRALGAIFLLPDGKAVDFSDKGGRSKLVNTIDDFKTKLTELLNKVDLANKEYADKLSNAVPESITAEFCQGDRDRIDWLKKYSKRVFIILIVWLLVPCILLWYGGQKVGEANSRSAELEVWYTNNYNAINFGNYMKEYNLATYEYWRSNRWKNDKALRDSVKEANKMREWK